MRSLQAFFKWYTNEGPDPDAARDKARQNLTDLGWDALGYAAAMIENRAGEEFASYEESIEWALRMNSWALRELALAMCEPLEKMFAVVEEKVPSQSGEFEIEVETEPVSPWFQRNDQSAESIRRVNKLLWDPESGENRLVVPGRQSGKYARLELLRHAVETGAISLADCHRHDLSGHTDEPGKPGTARLYDAAVGTVKWVYPPKKPEGE